MLANFPPVLQFTKDDLIIKFEQLTYRRDKKTEVTADYIYQSKQPRKGKISGIMYRGTKDGQTITLSIEQIQKMIDKGNLKIINT